MTEQPGGNTPTPSRSKPCPAKPGGRRRSIYVLWGVALSLLLAAGLFSWLVVVPVWKVRAVVHGVHRESDFQRAAAKLGDSATGLASVRLYLRMPNRVAPLKRIAVCIAREYGEESVELLVEALDHHNPRVRHSAAMNLGTMGRDAAPAELHLQGLLLDESHPVVRRAAAEALKKIRSSEGEQFGGWIRDEGLPVTPGTPAATRYVLPKWVDSLPRRLITCPVGASVREVYKHLGRTRLHRLSTGNPLPGPSPKTMTQEYELVELSKDGLKDRHRYNLVIMWTIVGKELRFKSGRLVRASKP